jgi:transposase
VNEFAIPDRNCTDDPPKWPRNTNIGGIGGMNQNQMRLGDIGGQTEDANREAAPAVRGKPRLKPIVREQLLMRTIDVDRLVGEDHPIRGIWAMVCCLDLRRFEESIRAVEGKAGQRTWDPRLLISLWIYAYSEAVSSARELSRMIENDPGCQWLTAMETIDYHTLSDFRVEHQKGLDEIFVQVLGVRSAEGLIEMKRVMHDGTKIRANASRHTFQKKQRIEEHLKLAKQQVKEMGDAEAEELSPRVAKARARAKREKQERLQAALQELERLQETKTKECRASSTDPDSRVMKQPYGGFSPSYNVQITTDAKAGIIVGVTTTQAMNDSDQLVGAVERFNQRFSRHPLQVVVDGAYTNRANVEAMHALNVDLIAAVPAKLKARIGNPQPTLTAEFQAQRFDYNESADCYTCPAGKTLRLTKKQIRRGSIEYSYRAEAAECQRCAFRDLGCPKSKTGRWIVRTEHSSVVKTFLRKMETEEAKEIYRTRSQVAEFPNCWIKAKIGLRQFRLRGIAKVQIESVWVSLTYNIQQWLRLCWKSRLARNPA